MFANCFYSARLKACHSEPAQPHCGEHPNAQGDAGGFAERISDAPAAV